MREPVSIAALKAAWNAKADKYNQWDDLGIDEIVAFALEVERVRAADDRARLVRRLRVANDLLRAYLARDISLPGDDPFSHGLDCLMGEEEKPRGAPVEYKHTSYSVTLGKDNGRMQGDDVATCPKCARIVGFITDLAAGTNQYCSTCIGEGR